MYKHFLSIHCNKKHFRYIDIRPARLYNVKERSFDHDLYIC